MALSDLLTRPVQVVSQQSDDAIDEYGNEIPIERIETVQAFVQQQTTGEREGYVPTGNYLLVLPAGTEIQADDYVIIDNRRYTVSGDPDHVMNPRTRKEHHIECGLTRMAGGLEEGS